jgi:hypothetical protein
MEKKIGVNPKHTFAVALAVVIGSLFIWIVQLARQGDPVGYIILTGTGVLLTLLVVGVVLRLLLAVSSQSSGGPGRSDMKHVYDTQRVLAQQNRALADQLRRLQKSDPLLSAEPAGPDLQPGQIMTADGYVIDSQAFDILEEAR